MMSRSDAHEKAVKLFGDNAVVGGPGRPVARWSHPECYYVGERYQAEWVRLGTGDTYEEAFTNVKKVVKQTRDMVEYEEVTPASAGKEKRARWVQIRE